MLHIVYKRDHNGVKMNDHHFPGKTFEASVPAGEIQYQRMGKITADKLQVLSKSSVKPAKPPLV